MLGSLCALQVGINLGDPIFRGVYHGKQAHEDDLGEVIQRAVQIGCTKMMVTGSDLEESRKAIQLAKDHRKCQWRAIEYLSPDRIAFDSGALLCYSWGAPLLRDLLREIPWGPISTSSRA